MEMGHFILKEKVSTHALRIVLKRKSQMNTSNLLKYMPGE